MLAESTEFEVGVRMTERKDEYAKRLLDVLSEHTRAGSAQWLNRGFDLGLVFCFVREDMIVVTHSPNHPQSPVLLEVRGIQFSWEPGTPGYEAVRELIRNAVPDNDRVVAGYWETIENVLRALQASPI
jgi:hypothetical protein